MFAAFLNWSEYGGRVKKSLTPPPLVCVPQVKNHIWVFVNALIENPTFDSQTKENMTLQTKSFGSKCLLSEKFVRAVRTLLSDFHLHTHVLVSPIKQLVFVTHRQPTVGSWRAYSTGWSSKLRHSWIKSAHRWSTARSKASPSWTTPTTPVCEQCDDLSRFIHCCCCYLLN